MGWVSQLTLCTQMSQHSVLRTCGYVVYTVSTERAICGILVTLFSISNPLDLLALA